LAELREKAIAMLTRGAHFTHDQQSEGKTGNWEVNLKSLKDIDKVIIYKRSASAQS